MANQKIEQLLPTLMYHSISNAANAKLKKCAANPQYFADQMQYLPRNNSAPINVSYFTKDVIGASRELPNHPIALTFDGGFADFYTNAFPLLRQSNFADGESNRKTFLEGWYVLKTIFMECISPNIAKPQNIWAEGLTRVYDC